MPRTDMVTLVPDELDARRVELGITIPEFAKLTSLSEQTLRTARGGRLVSLSTAREIARVLRCPVTKLLSSSKPKFYIETPAPADVREAI